MDGLKRVLRDVGMDPELDVRIGPVPGSAGMSFGIAAAKALEEGKLDGFWANGMGAEVALRNGTGTLVLNGSFARTAGTFTASTGTTLFSGTSAQDIGAAMYDGNCAGCDQGGLRPVAPGGGVVAAGTVG